MYTFFSNFLMWMWIFFISGCQRENYQDPDIKKTKEDFLCLTKPVCKRSSVHCIPLQKKCSKPCCYDIPVSICLSGQLPLQEVFFELAKQSNVNIVFDRPCAKSTTVLYRAQEKPLEKVLDDLSSTYDLRYYYHNDTLHIAPDSPHLKIYNVQFLIGARKTQTETSVRTDILGQGNKGKSAFSQENGASIQIKSQNEVNFWEELENNVQYILKEPINKEKPSYALNRYAGTLSVWGNSKQHRAIELYLKHLQKLATTQILIEAKIIEIELTDEHKSGIQWDALPALSAAINAKANMQDGAFFSFFIDTKNLNAFANFMSKFGTVRTLANPRLTVLNNQASVLKVARNEVFFEMQMDEVMMTANSPHIQKARSQIQTVPIGLILYVHPVVNFETGQIVLFLHPTISRIIDVKNDPAIALSMKGMATQVKSEIPVIQVREMDSVVAAKENQVIILGGLMEETSEYKTSGIPFLCDIPLLGALFSSEEKVKRITELVILLRPRILRTENPKNMSPEDQRLYQEFTQDPRPFPVQSQ
ncbi:type II secretion system protein D [Holospora undulata HU1]|uniref:Type II secretion system protein D n=2 Tax=Holospora TaxID=44747 RepID=A0A061JI48_9PROT|nr:type II secretion system protein D [Holospora undulata HU1]